MREKTSGRGKFLSHGCKCKICGRFIRGDCIHYGGQSCTACAAFFFRSLNAKHPYTCENDDMCLAIPSIKGAKCQKCRLNKCYEIGMQHPNTGSSATENEEEIYKEYLILAKKLYALFVTATNNPQLVLNFYTINDFKLLTDANLFFDNNHNAAAAAQIPSYIGKWATLFQINQISIAEFPSLFYSIVSNIKFPWLSIQDQQMITFFQRQSYNQFLLRSPYRTQEIKDGINKMIEYFQEQYEKFFAITKMSNNNNNSVDTENVFKN